MHESPHWRAAVKTRQPGAIVDQEVLLKIAGAAVAADVIAQARTAGADCEFERSPDFSNQQRTAFGPDAARRRFRIDAGLEQRLVGVDISDPGDEMAVHQRLLYRGASISRFAIQPCCVEFRAKRFGPDIL